MEKESSNIESGQERAVLSGLSDRVQRVKTMVFFLTGAYPSIFYPLISVRKDKRVAAVRKDTEIVIEGFPRSGNTYAVAAFMIAQQRPVKIARHLHAAAQVIRGVEAGLPVIVLIRRPVEAVSSFVIRVPQISISEALYLYIRFYETLLPYRGKVLVAKFEEVTQDFGQVIHRLNSQFGGSFLPFDQSKENVEACYRLIEEMDMQDTGAGVVIETTVARPSVEREALKKALEVQFHKSRNKALLQKADQLYQRYIS